MTSRPAIDIMDFPYLQGNYAPVQEEYSHDEGEGGLRVEGEIPANLVGAYMRNGPNIAWEPNHYVYPADGDGMVHAVYFKNGRAKVEIGLCRGKQRHDKRESIRKREADRDLQRTMRGRGRGR